MVKILSVSPAEYDVMKACVGWWVCGGVLIQRLEAGETLFGRHCLRLMGVEVEGRGCANSRADKREGTRGILLSYVSRQSAYFQQQQFACMCSCMHASICFHACACACVCALCPVTRAFVRL